MFFVPNLFRFLRLSCRVFNASAESGSYHRFVKKYVLPEVIGKIDRDQSGITERCILKMQWYMVAGIFLGELLARLINKRLSKEDRIALAWCGGLISMSDIAVDELGLENRVLEGLLAEDAEKATNGPVEKLLLFIYRETLKNIPPGYREKFREELIRGMKSQLTSSRQLNAGITEEEVTEITISKGCASVMLCYRILSGDNNISIQFLRNLGGFIQYLNDTQDLPRDIREGVITFARFKKDFGEIEKELFTRKKELFDSCLSLNLSSKKINDFLFVFESFYWGIIFKLRHYERICHNDLSPEKILSIPVSEFRINPVSPGFFWFCLPEVLRFGLKHLS